jgi:hypothetical protein
VGAAQLKSTLEHKVKVKSADMDTEKVIESQAEEPQVEQVEARAIPLGHTTSELEQQLRDALDDAHDVLQHTDDAFDTKIPTDAEHQDLPDLFSPDPPQDNESLAGEDTSYITVTSEEVNYACGDLLESSEKEDASLQVQMLQPMSEQTDHSAPDTASPIDQLSALRERLHQIRSVAALPETPSISAAKSVTVVDTAETVKTPEATVGDEPLKPSAPAASEAIQTSDAELTETQTTETLSKPDKRRAELEQKSRKELQAIAKAHGIKANLSSSKIIDALFAQ